MDKTKKERMERSAAYFYVCAHDASNSPCAEGCHPREAKKVSVNWQNDYEPDGPPGTSDSVSTK